MENRIYTTKKNFQVNITNNSLVWYGNFSGSKIILDKDINIATGKKLRFSAKDSPTDNELEIDIGLNTFTESGRGELKLNGTSGEILKVYDVTISGTVVIVEEEEELYTANVLGGVSPNTYLWGIRRFGEQTWITISMTPTIKLRLIGKPLKAMVSIPMILMVVRR